MADSGKSSVKEAGVLPAYSLVDRHEPNNHTNTYIDINCTGCSEEKVKGVLESLTGGPELDWRFRKELAEE